MTAVLYINVNKCFKFTCGSLETPRLPNQQPKHHRPIHALQGNGLCLHDSGQTAFLPVQFYFFCRLLSPNTGYYFLKNTGWSKENNKPLLNETWPLHHVLRHSLRQEFHLESHLPFSWVQCKLQTSAEYSNQNHKSQHSRHAEMIQNKLSYWLCWLWNKCTMRCKSHTLRSMTQETERLSHIWYIWLDNS